MEPAMIDAMAALPPAAVVWPPFVGYAIGALALALVAAVIQLCINIAVELPPKTRR